MRSVVTSGDPVLQTLERQKGAALDPNLRALADKQHCLEQLPLAVRRFVHGLGESCTLDAARVAVDALLAQYARAKQNLCEPISVETLCALCGIELTGVRPRAKGPAISAADPFTRAYHTGKLYLEDQKLRIRIPSNVDRPTARVSIAHELGHALIHRRGESFDEATMKLPSSPEEEALAEYAARLLLMPARLWTGCSGDQNLAEYAVRQAGLADVTLHAAVARLGDPDVDDVAVKGAILWKLNRSVGADALVHERLTPHWHLCPNAFIPINRSQARSGSLVSDLAADKSIAAAISSRVENVGIGTLTGRYRVDGFAWGSLAEHTRLILTVFSSRI